MQSRFDRFVECSAGHLFTTIWVPLASLKAVRLGGERLQRCPVGKHWAWVHQVDPKELTTDERAEAAATHDAHIM